MWQRSGDKAGFGVIHYHAALLRLILQDYEGALEHIRTGLRHLSGGLAPRGWAWLLLCKAEVLHRLGEAEAAKAALAEARDRMTRIGEQRGLQRAEITAKTLQSARG
jgi:hypothetical protein